MTVVVDASVTMAWCFEDERSEATDALLEEVARHGGVVPALWSAEVANVLLVAERRARVTRAEAGRLVALLDRLPLERVEVEPGLTDLVTLGRERGLTAFDAAYLACALSEGLPLATLDGALAEAARAVGVRLALS